MRPPLTVAAEPVPVMPSGSRRRSSPSPFCQAIAPVLRSYAVNVVYGGLMMVGYSPNPSVTGYPSRTTSSGAPALAGRFSPGFSSRMIVGTLKPIT